MRTKRCYLRTEAAAAAQLKLISDEFSFVTADLVIKEKQ